MTTSLPRPEPLEAVSKASVPRISRVLPILVAALLLLAIVTGLSDLRQVSHQLASANPLFLLAALAVFALFMIDLSEFYRSAFRASGLNGKPLRFLVVTSASHFINLVSKSSGFGGLSLYLREGQSDGVSAARVSAAYLATYVLGYVAFLSVLIASLSILAVAGNLTSTELLASIVLLCLVSVVATLLAAGYRNPQILLSAAGFVAGAVNRLARAVGKAEALSPATIREAVSEFHDAVRVVVSQPSAFLRPLCHALGVELLSALTLYIAARAIGAPISLAVALAGYAFSLLFSILSITPGGLGFVEVSLTVFLVSFQMSRPQAEAVTLVFRFFDFWLPVAFGAISWLFLRSGRAPTTAK